MSPAAGIVTNRPAWNLLLLATIFGCEGSRTQISDVRVGPSVESLDLAGDLIATDGNVAATNLVSSTEAWIATSARQPETFAHRSRAIDFLLARTQFLGSYADFSVASRLADEALVLAPNDPNAFLVRGRVRTAVHEFAAAEADVTMAARLGARDVEPRLEVIELAVGADVTSAIANARARAAEYPSFAATTALAALLAGAGRFDEADAQYVAAVRTYRDVSPFPLAWVAFQRGVMWGEMADRPDLARLLYEEATRRLPDYVVANVHLAELEVAAGEADRAIERMRHIVTVTTDPEPFGVLGELLADRDTAESARYIEMGRTGYNELLQRFPKAFADHGAEFFAGPGNERDRAVELATMNLRLRPTARAYIVAMESAHAAGRFDLLCGWHRDSASAALTHPSLAAVRKAFEQPCR